MNSYRYFPHEETSFSWLFIQYILLASFTIALPLGAIISRLLDSWMTELSMNWSSVYLVMIICAALALVTRFFEISEFSIYFVVILAIIDFIGFGYSEREWRSRTDEGKQKGVSHTEDLANIDNIQNIEKVILRKKNLTRIDLSPLSQCNNLRELDLIFNRLESIDLSPLAYCSNLEILRLDENELTEIDLTPLTSLSNLKGLTIQLNNLQSISLEPLRSCTNLEVLFLGGNHLKKIDLSPLSNCKELLKIGFDTLSTNPDLTPLENCTKLESFSIEGDRFKKIDLEPLKHCQNLEFIGIMANLIEELDLSPLESCKKLREIEFNNESPLSMNVTGLFSIPEFSKLGWIDVTTRLWADQIPPEDDWPKGLRKYRKRIDLGH